jgi:arylsulfatase A-like enzyme
MTGLDPPRHGVRHNSIHRLGDDLPTLAESMRAAGFATAAFVGSVVLERRFGLDRGFDVYDDQGHRWSSPTVGYTERPASDVVDAALDWLALAPERFFLWVHFYDPHARYAPPPGFAAAFASRPYAGEIAFVDRELGRLLAGIDARFGPTGRLVAVTSDHGESLGEHGEQTHAYGIYDATQRIPLIFSGAGLPSGRVVETPVRLVDVAPTLLAAAAAAPLPGAGGRDLAPLFHSTEAAVGEPAYLETLATRLDYGWSPLLGLRTSELKYIRAPRPELYDLVRDPDELRNLAEERPERVAELDALLAARLAQERAASADVELSAAERAGLRSLGYVVADGGGPDRGPAPDPKDEIALLGLVSRSEALAESGRLAEGLALLEELEEPPLHVRILRASLRQRAGRPGPAADDARRALEAAPRRVDARIILALALEAEGDLAEARATFETATRLEPRSLQAWQGVARTAGRLGDAAGALEAESRVDALSAGGGDSDGGDPATQRD